MSRNTKKVKAPGGKSGFVIQLGRCPQAPGDAAGIGLGALPHNTPKYLPPSGIPWDRLPRELVQSLYLQVPKNQVDMGLSDMG